MGAAMIVTLCDISETRFGRLHDADRCHGRLDYKVLLLRIKMLLHSTDSESANLVGWGWPISMHRQEGATQLMPLLLLSEGKSEAQSHCEAELLWKTAIFVGCCFQILTRVGDFLPPRLNSLTSNFYATSW
jgi:hypothetical protein